MVNKMNKGSALLSALFIMTLIAIAATAMSMRLQLEIYRTRLIINRDSLALASQAVVFWSMDRLSQPQPLPLINKISGQVLAFPQAMASMYPLVTLQGAVFDLQARFNLNNLQNAQGKVFFYGLLENVLRQVDANQRHLIIDASVNWLGPYIPGRGHDKLYQFYAHQTPSYYPSYQTISHVSEFRLIDGVDASIYQKLLPFLTALPDLTPININTAPPPLLKSLGNGLTDKQVNDLLKARSDKGLHEFAVLNELLTQLNIPAEQVTLDSSYFLCVTTAKTTDLSITTYTILKRMLDKTNQHLTLSIVNESLSS